MNVPRWFSRRRDEELDEELQSHLRMAIQDRVERGEVPEEAAAAARREFGNVGLVREVTRDQWGWGWLERLARDLEYAFRGLLHNRVYALAAILTLALGIGANTAIFSLLDSLVLRALPVREPDRLVLLSGRPNHNWTYPTWDEVRRRTELFEGACAFSTTRFDLARMGPTEMADGLWVSGRFFEVLGVRVVLGRTLTESDDRRGGGPEGPVAVISHGFWQRRFGGAADVVGKTVTVDRAGVPVRIVGVAAPGFLGPEVGRSFDLALPIGAIEALSGRRPSLLDARLSWWLKIIARLRPDQTIESATATFRRVQAPIRVATMPQAYQPKDYSRHLRSPFSLLPAATGISSLRAQYARPLAALMAIVGLVLLVACANVANLQLARGAARRHELSVRRALGASRARLARQTLLESLLLSVGGAALGLVVARWVSRLLVSQLSTWASAAVLDLRFDWRLLGFATVAAAATAVVFGAVPALSASRTDAGEALRDPRGRVGVRRNVAGGALVVAQVGLSLVLVIGAGLFLRSFAALATLDLGIDTDRVLVVEVRGAGAVPPAKRQAFLDAVREAAASIAGVERASLASIAPVTDDDIGTGIEVPGSNPMSPEERSVYANNVSPGWFATVGARVLTGRDFSAGDRAGAPLVVVVNEALAQRFFTGQSPVGRTVRFGAIEGQRIVQREAEIVGVVEDSVYRNVRAPAPPTLYQAFAQAGTPSGAYLFARSARGAHAALGPRITSAVAKLDPGLALTVRSMRDHVSAAVTQDRLIAALSGCFGLLALVLAGIGVLGVTAHGVQVRRAEIGLRIALGASSGGVMRLVLGRVTVLTALGIAAGGAASYWASRLVGSLLFGIEPRDPATFAGAAIVLALVGTAAGAIPAWRASRIDPTAVMRAQ